MPSIPQPGINRQTFESPRAPRQETAGAAERPITLERPKPQDSVQTSASLSVEADSTQVVSISPADEVKLKEIEMVLSRDLEEIYFQMPAPLQQQFKARGEEVAKTLRQMLQQAKLTARKVMALIGEWLSLIPGVNKYFIEQQTKIKTDEILKMQG